MFEGTCNGSLLIIDVWQIRRELWRSMIGCMEVLLEACSVYLSARDTLAVEEMRKYHLLLKILLSRRWRTTSLFVHANP